MFNKLFKTYPQIDKSKIQHNALHALTRKEMFAILKGIKDSGGTHPFSQPTRTSSYDICAFLYQKMSK